jgi:hypothetical protein
VHLDPAVPRKVDVVLRPVAAGVDDLLQGRVLVQVLELPVARQPVADVEVPGRGAIVPLRAGGVELDRGEVHDVRIADELVRDLEGEPLALVACAGRERRGPRLEQRRDVRVVRERADLPVLDHEGEVLQVGAGPVGRVALHLEVAVDVLELLVPEMGLEVDVQVEPGDALLAREELVQGSPEVAVAVALDGITRSEELRVGSAHPHRDVGGEALRDGAEDERVVRVERRERPRLRVVARAGRTHPRDAGAREGEIRVASVHRVGRSTVVESEDDDAERALPRTPAELGERRRLGAVDVVLDRLDLRERRVVAKVLNDRGRRERVVEEAAGRAAGLDAARGARPGEVLETRNRVVDRDGLCERVGEGRGRDVEPALGGGHQQIAPAAPGEPSGHLLDAADQLRELGPLGRRARRGQADRHRARGARLQEALSRQHAGRA